MLDIFFTLLFFIFPFMAFKYLKLLGFSVFTISIPSFLMISMFLYAYSGILPLYFGWDEYRYNFGVQDKYLITQMLIYSIICIVGLLGGFTFAKFNLKMKKFQGFHHIRKSSKNELLVLVILMVLCFVVLLVYLSKIETIALLTVFFNDGDPKVARSLMGNDFSGKYHWYTVFMHDLLSIVTFAFFSAYLIKKQKFIFFLFVVSFLICSFSTTMATEKGPFAKIIIGLFLVYAMTISKGKLPLRSIFILLFSLFSSLITFYLFFMGSADISSAISAIFSRALSGSIQPAYHYLEFFPEHHDFLLGASFPNPGGIMPFEPYRLTQEIMNWVNPNTKGIVGSMPTVFWGEAYANFSVYGILLISFFVGVIVCTVYYFVDKLENTPFKIGFVAYLMMHYQNLSITGFSGFIIDFQFSVIFIIVCISIALANKMKIKFIKYKSIIPLKITAQ